MADWPTLDEVRQFLRLPSDPVEDAVLQDALDAAVDYGTRRTSRRVVDWSTDPPTVDYVPLDPVPSVAHYAAKQHAARLYRRRDSTDGTIGFGDAGVVRIGRTDPDIEALYGQVSPMVVG